MRIIKFTAENVKKLKAVEITPSGNVVEVTGPNGSGKSSVLDAIFYALKNEAPTAVVRQGEDKAFVKLDLGELVVTRRFTAVGGTSLIVEAANGARFPSPQRMLDDLVGSLSFDPLAFTRLKPREQLDELKRAVNLDLTVIEAQIKQFFEARTATNRIVRELETRLAATSKVPAETPDESIDVAALVKQLEEAGARNTRREIEANDRLKRALEIGSAKDSAKQREAEAVEVWERAEEECRLIMQRANERRVGLLQSRDTLTIQIDKATAELNALPPVSDKVDTSELVAAVNQAGEMNKQVELKRKRAKLADDLRLQVEKAARESETIKSLEAKRLDAITETPMPVQGLSLADNEVLFNGLPLANASSGEQLRISVALAMAANPKLRVLRVKDGSLLDESNLKLLSEMATEGDYQVWVERVEDSRGRPAVVMEDGNVNTAHA